MNEISDHKYVSKAELQEMFANPGMPYFSLIYVSTPLTPALYRLFHRTYTPIDLRLENAFTPWFKLIARDFLFGWWDELLSPSRLAADGKCVAKNLNGVVDGSKVVKMV